MNAKHSDVTFIVENAKIPAHKTILSARCLYFQTLFGGEFAEANQNEIKLEVPLHAFKMVLRFIYTGCMSLQSLNVNQIIEIYDLAEQYDFESLKESIPKYLATNLTLENCFDVLKTACLYSMDDLQNACLKFIDRHSTDLISSDSFKTIPLNLLCTLLKRDTFFAPEIDIFNAVKNWTISYPAADSKVNLFAS